MEVKEANQLAMQAAELAKQSGHAITLPKTTSFATTDVGNQIFLYNVPEWVCSVLCAGLDVDELMDMKLDDGMDPVPRPPKNDGGLGESAEKPKVSAEQALLAAQNAIKAWDPFSVYKTVRGQYPCDGNMPFWEHCVD